MNSARLPDTSSTIPSAMTVPSRRSLLALAVLALASTAPPKVSAAEGMESAGALEEVIVTATRRQEGLQSVPVSITAVTGSTLDNRGLYNFQEVAEAVSGLELKQPRGHVSSAIYIRGVGTASSSAADPSVGVVLDGVYQVRLGAVFAEMLDVDRVEVLRGPQGTLFGKNTTAGVIRIETIDPDTEAFSGRIQGIAGNLDDRELRGAVNIPLVDGVLGARISGYKVKRDGYTRNTFTGDDTNNVDRKGIRGKVLWTPTETLSFDFSAEQFEQGSNTTQGLVRYPEDKLAQFGDILPPIGPGRYAQQHAEVEDDIDRYILTATWEAPNHTLTSITGYEDQEASLLSDRDLTILGPELGPTTLTHLTNVGTFESTTQELQLTSDWDGPLNYIVGAFWQQEELESTTVLFFGGSDVPLNRPPSVSDVVSKAVFGNVTYEFNQDWNTSIGVRYTEDEKQGSNNQFEGITTFEEATYSFKLRYQMDADRMLYLAVDSGFKPGGINREFNLCGRVPGARCLTPEEAMWDSETTVNYELGLKSVWLDNRLRLNAALFLQNYEDFQVNQSVPGEGTAILTNAAEVESKGLELDLAWVLSESFTLSGNMSYVETRYESYEDAPCATPTSPGCVDGSQDLSGKTLNNAPELTYSLSGEYRAPLGTGNLEWFGRVDVTYTDEQNLYEFLSPDTVQDAYYLANAGVGLESPGQWKLSAWGRNLADEEYWTSAEESVAGLIAYIGAPRTYGVTFDWFF